MWYNGASNFILVLSFLWERLLYRVCQFHCFNFENKYSAKYVMHNLKTSTVQKRYMQMQLDWETYTIYTERDLST